MPEATREQYDDMLASIALYIDWRYVTKQLTTVEKELFADAIERACGGPIGYVDRWWRD